MERHPPELSEPGAAVSPASADLSPRPPSAEAPSSDRAEGLLRQGEELFARGRYDEAIHVWTRIRFIDKNDRRARTSIDRGKRAIAERQRRLDVELVGALRLVDDGELEAAREIVSEVIRQDPRHTEAHQLSERLDALERRGENRAKVRPSAESGAGEPALGGEEESASKRGLRLRVPRTGPPSRLTSPASTPLKMAGFVLGAILILSSGALYLHLNWESIVSDGAFSGAAHSSSAALSRIEAPVPDGAELHFFNGERLYRKGRYREALVELSAVPRDAGVAEPARSLILRIEERLLRGASEPEDAPSSEARNVTSR